MVYANPVGVTRYLEFKSVEGSYVLGKSGKISKVYCNCLSGFCITLQNLDRSILTTHKWQSKLIPVSLIRDLGSGSCLSLWIRDSEIIFCRIRLAPQNIFC
jgi:GDP dissociation inhibitor